MADIVLNATVGEDRKLILELPPNTPTGNVQIVVRQSLPHPQSTLTRDEARQRLLDAGFLVTSIEAPEGIQPSAPDELLEIGKLPPSARPSEELIDEDRGKY